MDSQPLTPEQLSERWQCSKSLVIETINEGKAVLETMEHTWKALGQHFGYLLPNLIKRKTCTDYIETRRAAGKADGTIWTELGHLSTVMIL